MVGNRGEQRAWDQGAGARADNNNNDNNPGERTQTYLSGRYSRNITLTPILAHDISYCLRVCFLSRAGDNLSLIHHVLTSSYHPAHHGEQRLGDTRIIES